MGCRTVREGHQTDLVGFDPYWVRRIAAAEGPVGDRRTHSLGRVGWKVHVRWGRLVSETRRMLEGP